VPLFRRLTYASPARLILGLRWRSVPIIGAIPLGRCRTSGTRLNGSGVGHSLVGAAVAFGRRPPIARIAQRMVASSRWSSGGFPGEVGIKRNETKTRLWLSKSLTRGQWHSGTKAGREDRVDVSSRPQTPGLGLCYFHPRRRTSKMA
jgi:hypothetical protein